MSHFNNVTIRMQKWPLMHKKITASYAFYRLSPLLTYTFLLLFSVLHKHSTFVYLKWTNGAAAVLTVEIQHNENKCTDEK